MGDSPKILKSIAADSSLALILKVCALPLSYLTNLAMARLYGAERMGTFYIALNLALTLVTFCSLGFGPGLMRFAAGMRSGSEPGKLKRLFWPAIGLAAALAFCATLALLGLRPWVAAKFQAPGLLSALQVIAWVVPILVVAGLCAETIRGMGGIRWVIVQQNALAPLSFLILLILLPLVGHYFFRSSRTLAFAYLLSNLVSLAFLVAWPWALYRRHPRARDGVSFQSLFRYSWPLYLSSVLWLGLNGVDSLILGYFSSAEAVAYYNVATKTAPIVTFPLLAINAVVPPLFARFHQQGDLEGLEIVCRATARWMYFVALPLGLLLILLAPQFLGFFGPGFATARFALVALVLSQLVNVAAGSVGYLLMMTGNQWPLILSQGFIGAGTVPLMALGAWFFGLNGLAPVSALAIVGINVLMVWAVWRRLKIKAFAQKVAPANLGGLLGVGLFYLTSPWLGPIVGAAFFSLGYLALTAKTIKQELLHILHSHSLAESVS